MQITLLYSTLAEKQNGHNDIQHIVIEMTDAGIVWPLCNYLLIVIHY